MQITTTFRQMESSPTLRSYAESKVEKLEKYHHGIIDARVAFSSGKTSHTVEITVNANGTMIRGEESAPDAYAALDLVIDKLSRQLRKHHDKVKNHKATTREEFAGGPSDSDDSETERRGSAEPAITSRGAYSMRPCFPDDALAQLDQSDSEFLVFLNAETNSVCGLFRKPDGNFGIIEPER